MLLTKHEVTIRIAIDAALIGGQTLTNDGMKNKTVCLWQAWITGSSLGDGEHTRGATLFLVVNVKPSMACLSDAKEWRTKQQSRKRLSR